ncbi:MAG: hypothetical protein IT267_12265 [Saprospiraceae bacterium]|nr:hypothetical protein [Saprospiraceae bacterium]
MWSSYFSYSKIKYAIYLFLFIVFVWIVSYPVESSALQSDVFIIHQFDLFESQYLYYYHHIFCFVPVFFISIGIPYFSTRFSFIVKNWKGILIGSVVFCLWDLSFTHLGIWGFNRNYILKMDSFSFPLEEILWFPIIGYCGLFIHELLKNNRKVKFNQTGSIVLLVCISITLITAYYNRIYTGLSFWSVLALIGLYNLNSMKEELMLFMDSFIIIILPMILTDGLLTGLFTKEPVVLYNPAEFSGIRVFSIPVEDFAFGFSFIGAINLINLVINKR